MSDDAENVQILPDALRERERGPIEILCLEIGEPFDKRLERPEMLLAFVAALVSEVGWMMELTDKISNITGKETSHPSAAALPIAQMMAAARTVEQAEQLAEQVHDISDAAGEEIADRPLEMLSACASAVRFGLENPCRSRHAADAARQVWKNKYGVSLWDRQTPDWQHQWARRVFHTALASCAVEAWNRRATGATP